jgi:hypothetical protein
VSLKNISGRAIRTEIASGQKFDLRLLRPGGKQVWQWSKGKMFPMMVQLITIKPWETISQNMEFDGPRLESGTYWMIPSLGPRTDKKLTYEQRPLRLEITRAMAENYDIRGHIETMARSSRFVRMLVSGQGHVDKASVNIDSSTRIFVQRHGVETAGSLKDLDLGALVEVTFEGPVAESYPVQGRARKIVVVRS